MRNRMKVLGLILLFTTMIHLVAAYDDPAFTAVGFSPRGRALGNAGYAIDLGSESLFYNPAAYRADKEYAFYCSYFKQYGLVDYGTLTATLPYHFITGLSYSDDGIYTELHWKTAYVFPQKVYDFVYVSASLSVLYSYTQPAIETGAQVQGKGYGLSPEIAFYCPVSDTFAVSFQLRDIGGFVHWETEAAEGMAYESKGIYTAMRTFDVINGYYYKPYPYLGISLYHRNFTSFGIGTEYQYKTLVLGRVGYTRYVEDEIREKLSFGLGFTYKKYSIDVAYEINSFQSRVMIGFGLTLY